MDIDESVGAGIVRENNERVDFHVGVEVVSGNGEVSE